MNRTWSFAVALGVLMFTGVATVPALTLTELGAKGGFVMADVYGNDATNLGPEYGLAAGGFAAVDINRQVRLQPELWYVQKGTETDEGNDDYKINLAYLEMPILLRWMIPREGALKPSLFVGGAAAYRLSAKVIGCVQDSTVDADADDCVEDMDFSAIVGGGLDIELGSGRVVTDVRYTLGLLSFWNDADGAPIDFPGDDTDIKNGVFSITVGYALQIGEL